MRYTILFVITLVVVSGFIAYIGDFLGRKMGKRRLTLWGLRPRHTAVVATIVTGMVIAIATLATIMGVSTSIREVLITGEQRIAQNKQLTKENRSLVQTSLDLQKKEQQLRTGFEKARKELADATTARDQAASKVEGLTKLIAARLKDLNDLRGKKALTEQELARKAVILSATEKDLKTVQQALGKTNTDLASARDELSNAIKIVRDQYTTIESQKKAIETYDGQIKDQYAQLGKLGRENLQLGFGYDRLLRGNLVIKQGQELARAVVSQNQSALSIRADVFAVLKEASGKAKALGAGAGKNDRAVTVIAPGVTLDETDCINAATTSISKSPVPVLVQVLACSNSVEGEQTPVALHLYRNDLAISKGARIAATQIDGRQPEGKILVSLVNFLRTDVRKAADSAGVVPVASPDPEIKGDQLDDLMNLVDKIKQMDMQIGLRVSAKKDIYSASTLSLDNLEFAISTVTARASANSR